MKQEIYLEKDGSGTANIEIILKKFVLTTIKDLAEISSVDPDESFNPDVIAKSMMENPDITNVVASRPTENKIKIKFDFNNIQTMFEESDKEIKDSGLITISNDGDKTILTLSINKGTYKGISSLIPQIDDPAMSALLPNPEDDDATETEYLEMIEYMFGDEGPSGVMDSSLNLVININGTIIEQIGGKELNKSKVEFNIPLIRILLLDQDLTYSVTYK